MDLLDRLRLDVPVAQAGMGGGAGRAGAVNLLMPFARRAHVDACVEERIDVAVMAFGIECAMTTRHTEGGVLVFVMAGTDRQARQSDRMGRRRADRPGM